MNLRPRVQRLLEPWDHEPEAVDEVEFSPQSGPGWSAWNAFSPEVEMCETAAQVVRMVRPSSIVETGVGQGYTTRRVAAAKPAGSTYLCFESDDELRPPLAALPFFAGSETVVLSDRPSPSLEELGTTELAILDSGPEHRREELERWKAAARPGAYLLVHDTGNGHPEWTPHHKLRSLIEQLDIPGVFFTNPRGALLGQQR